MAVTKPLKIGTDLPIRTFETGDYIATEFGAIPTGGSPAQVLSKIDGTDFNTQWVDPSGGSVDIIDITYADMATAIAGSTLTKGQFYRITDAAGTDLGVIVQAIRDNEISVGGNGGFYNADFQAVGDYSGVNAETGVAPLTQLGIWRLGFETFTIDYINLAPNYITYSIFEFSDGETYLTDLGNTGTILSDDAAGNVILVPNQQLTVGEIIIGDTSLNRVNILTSVDPTVTYTIFTGPLTNGETYTTDLANTGTILIDDTLGTVTLIPNAPLSIGEVITGDSSTNSITVDAFTDASVTYAFEMVDGEAYTTNLGNTGFIIHDDNAGLITITPDQPLVAGEILTGTTSTSIVTIDTYVSPQFAIGDTITDTTTSAQALITGISGSTLTVYQTVAGGFNTTEQIDNGFGVTADIDTLTSASILTGDLVIWNLTHYQCIDATLLDGTDPATNTNAYYELPRTLTDVGYIEEWDVVEFDFLQNLIVFRSDLRGNIVRGNVGVAGFQWGSGSHLNNNIQFPNSFDITNLIASFQSNTVYSAASVFSIITDIQSEISNNILENGAQLFGITAGDNVSIVNNKIGTSGYIGDQIVFGSGCLVQNNILENSAQLTGITAGANCSISNNKVGSAGLLGNIETGTGAEIIGNNILNNARIDGLVFGDFLQVKYNTVLANGSIADIQGGSTVYLNSNYLFADAEMSELIFVDNCEMFNNTLENGGALTDIETGSNCSISRNKIGQGATMGGSTTLGDGAQINDNVLGNSAILGTTTMGVSAIIQYCKLSAGAAYFNNQLADNAYIQYIDSRSGVQIAGCILEASSGLDIISQDINGNITNTTITSGNYIGTSYLTISIVGKTLSTIQDKTAQQGFSTFEESFDITGLTTLDWIGENSYVGIGNLTSSNATETIDTINNFPIAFPFIIKPAAGLVLTVTGTAIGSAVAGSIVLTTANIVLDGDKQEYLELQSDPTNTFVIEKSRVVGII